MEKIRVLCATAKNEIGKNIIINAYCATSKESESVKEIIKKYNAKYFVKIFEEIIAIYRLIDYLKISNK